MRTVRGKNILVLVILLLSAHYSQQLDSLPRTGSRHDYRFGKNVPAYDKTIFPLGTVKTPWGTWEELNPKVPYADYMGISFRGTDTGWAVGQSGTIIYTTNSGTKWHWSPGPTPAHLLSVNSYDGRTVIACGSWGAIIRSTDGGVNWNNVVSGVTEDLWSVQMLDDSTGWICGQGPKLLKTTNSGRSWDTVDAGLYGVTYWTISFFNKQTGYIGSDNGKILKTIDGGKNWQLKKADDSTSFFSIAALDSSTIVAAGQKGHWGNVAYSGNGGSTYSFSEPGYPIFSIACANDSVWVGTSYTGLMYKTTNRGNYWYYLSGDLGGECVTFIDSVTAFNCGEGLTINKSTNQGWNWTKSIINDNFCDVQIISPTNGWIFGEALYHTRDLGTTLEYAKDILNGNMIRFYDSLHGIYTDNYSYKNINYTSDGGVNWIKGKVFNYPDTTSNYGMLDFAYINKDTVLACGIGGAIKTTDGCHNWYSVNNGAYHVVLRKMSVVDNLTLWAAGAKVVKTTDCGLKWEQQNVPFTPWAYDIRFFDQSNGWIINNSQFLSKTTDGGRTWQPVDGPINLETMQWYDNRTGIVSGDFGRYLYKTSDGGWLWHYIKLPENSPSFSKLYLYKKNEIMGVGGGGRVYKYVETLPIEAIKEENEFRYDVLLNYPNPFNAYTKIKYTIPERTHVVLKIYNVLGQLITTVIDEEQEAGSYSSNFYAGQLSSGIYYYKLNYKGRCQTKAMVIIK